MIYYYNIYLHDTLGGGYTSLEDAISGVITEDNPIAVLRIEVTPDYTEHDIVHYYNQPSCATQ